MAPRIYLMRHAQASHNIGGRWHLVDPDLTDNGVTECLNFSSSKHELQQRLTHLVASPSYRCIRTAILSFPKYISDGKLVILNPDVQEVANTACNIPSSEEDLADKADELIDRSLLAGVDYRNRGPDSPFRYDWECVVERARKARVYLRDIASAEHGSDSHIVVVSHAGFIPHLVQDVQPWYNAQMRTYEFEDPDGDDDEAALVLMPGDDAEDGPAPFAPPPPPPKGGGGGPPKGILKRRHDDDDDQHGGGSSRSKRAKSVAWAEQLEKVRKFRSQYDQDQFYRVPTTTVHPSASIKVKRNTFSSLMLQRARQIQRFADEFAEAEIFPENIIRQARAVQPLPWKTPSTEDKWPRNWEPNSGRSVRSVNSFLSSWSKNFVVSAAA